MAYMKIITSSSSWVCPKTGSYKIVCVAGGCDGESDNYFGSAGNVTETIAEISSGTSIPCTVGAATANRSAGGTTSFGALLSASGNAASPLLFVLLSPNPFKIYALGGQGGFTLDGVYGGAGGFIGVSGSSSDQSCAYPPTKNGGIIGKSGFGYGAGGGFVFNGTSVSVSAASAGVIIIQEV